MLTIKRSLLAEQLIYLEGKPFSFDEYEPFRFIYDSANPVITLLCGRQVGKSVELDEKVLMADGAYKLARHIRIGDRVACLDVKNNKIRSETVTWVSDLYQKKCYSVLTKSGNTINVAGTHPVRTRKEWIKVDRLKKGDCIASLQNNKFFEEDRNLKDFQLLELAIAYENETSQDLGLPDYIYRMNKRQTLLFLKFLSNRIVHLNLNSRICCFKSKSRNFLKQIQSLLWKFHIATNICESDAYILWCSNANMVDRFIHLIMNQQPYYHLQGASDVRWDTVLDIKDRGIQACIDFSVARYENFVIDGVVTHNSTSLANFLLTEGVSIPQFRSLFVAPSKEQTSRFSNTRFAKSLFFSPLIKKHFITNSMPANNVTLRMLANGSEFFFSYASDDAERIRGVSADRICYDEVQSMILEAIEPVIRECLGASRYKYRMYCGTPLSAENDIEVLLWQKSTKNEWVVKCKHCGGNNILGWKNIGPRHLICSNEKCEKEIDVRNGSWFKTNPKASNFGFRIPQIALHRNVATKEAYQSIIDKRNDYSKAQFNNEVLGVSDAMGARLISVNHIKALCEDYYWEDYAVNPKNMHGVAEVVGGIDWGGQSPTNVSRTTLGILGILPDGRLRLLYGKIYPSGHAIRDLDDIAKICTLFQCRIVVGDSGEGMLANAQLRQKLGYHIVFGNRYSGQKGTIKYNNNQNDPGYHSDKTIIIDQVMHCIIARRFQFPHWELMKKFSDDIMAAYEETTKEGRRIWKHAATRPDDFLHSLALGWLASKIVTGQVVMYGDALPLDGTS